MSSVDSRAVGSGYYRVYVSGVRFSQHTMPHKAFEQCADILASDPTLDVYFDHDLHVVVVPSEAATSVPAPVEPVLSDGGEDLIDFLTRIQGFENAGPNTEMVKGATWADRLTNFATKTKESWLIRRLYSDEDGNLTTKDDQVWIGIGWRGYILLWNNRDKTALRIGTGT